MDSISDQIVKLLETAYDAGLTLTAKEGALKIRGPESESELVQKIMDNKQEVMDALDTAYNHIDKEIQSLRDRLRKGIDWFVAVDPHLWDANDNPINQRTKLERKMTQLLHKWREMERLLRNLYDYEGCIYDDGGCPDGSPVKCGGCE